MAYEFRARGVGELIDATFRIYRSYWWTMVKTAGVVLLPAGIIMAGLQALFTVATQRLQASGDPGAMLGAMGLNMAMQVPAILFGLVLILADAAVVTETAEACYGRRPDLRTAWTAVKARLGPVLGAGALALVLTMVGICACCIGMPVMYVFVSMVIPVVMLEGARVGQSLQRTFNLVGGGFWRVVGVLVVFLLIMLVPGLLLAFGGMALLMVLGQQDLANMAMAFSTAGPLFLFLYYLVNSMYTAAVAPLQSIVKTLLYFDLRVRKEGLDLDQVVFSNNVTEGGPGGPLS